MTRAKARRRSDGLHIGGLVARTGVPIPPAAGRHRAAFLEYEGITCLRRSLQQYGLALRTVGLSLLPSLRLVPQPSGMWKTLAFADRGAEPRARQQKWRIGRKQVAREWHEACRNLRGSEFAEQKDTAESAAREALTFAIDAYNYLEDHRLAEHVHQYVHDVAEFVGGMFGCHVHMTDGTYWDECPLSLMHRRWGFSPGYTSRRLCSICHADIDECPHLIGHVYQVTVERNINGDCNGCGWHDCSHRNSQVIDVVPVALHDSIDLHEISMVTRPRDPLARARRIALDTETLRMTLGRTPRGEELSCYRCLDPCDGFNDLPDRHPRGSNYSNGN